MITQFTILILVLLAAVIFMQPTRERLALAMVFVGIAWAHFIFLGDADGLAYYGTAALFNLGAMIIISAVRPITVTALRLQQICIAEVYVNAIGWILWYFYHSLVIYNLAFVVLYAWALFILGRGTRIDLGDRAIDRRYSDIPGDLYTRWGVIRQNKGQA